MLQSYRSPPQGFADERRPDAGLGHYLATAKRRIFYLLVPFVIIFAVGCLLVAVQHPIYRAEGKILVETQDIPVDLVKPTVTDTANQRIQIIQQRITSRDNLLEIIKKFGLFRDQQRWMSASQILDLMRERTKLQLVDLTLPTQQNNLTIAFTLSFDHENPEIAAKVANEFLTLILNEDARNRTNRATETTKFLEQETKRLQGELASIQTQVTAVSLKPPDPIKEVPERVKEQRAELTKLKLELVQKSSVYSRAHPQVVALAKRIAALEKILADAPAATEAVVQADNGLDLLKQQLSSTETALDEATRKLSAARLGENLERNQQSERLQVIEQPIVPQKPIKPNKPKLLALAFALSVMASVGSVMAAEALDKSIHGVEELAGVVDNRLIVAVPYITTRQEALRKKSRVWLLLGAAVVLALVAAAAAFYLGLSIDLSSLLERSWIDQLRHLSK
jgi:uncharacterized protein involved in exopolysaccharide biosynthesis